MYLDRQQVLRVLSNYREQAVGMRIDADDLWRNLWEDLTELPARKEVK